MPRFEDLNTKEFLVALQEGSPESFERLARGIYTPLWRYLVLMDGVPELDAEEIAQDALMKVHRRVSKFRFNGQAKLTSWIFQIARNLAIDFHRANHPVLHELDENELSAHSGARFSGRNADYLSKLRDALEMLSTKDQEILLWRSRDITFAEIASWLNVKEVTARVRHLRAERRLRLCLSLSIPLRSRVFKMPKSWGVYE